MRIASLVGLIKETGNTIQLGSATGSDKVTELIAKFRGMTDTVLIKKNEIKLSELHLLANHTAGGELKSCRKFK